MQTRDHCLLNALEITVFEKYLLRDCDRDLRTPKDVAYKRRAVNPARGYLLLPHSKNSLLLKNTDL